MYMQLLLEGEDFLIKIQMLTALSRFCDLYQMWKVRDLFSKWLPNEEKQN